MLVFLLQKRSRIGFDESNEEEMLDLLSVIPPDLTSIVGQLYMEKDARVRLSDLADFGEENRRPLRPQRRVQVHSTSQ